MAEGKTADAALERVIREDPGREVRQLGMVDARGGSATFSGRDCTDWFGGVNGPGFAAQGNMLIRGETVSAMAQAFESGHDLDLGERLMRALEAGQAAGGGKPGRQTTALLVVVRGEIPSLGLPGGRRPPAGPALPRDY